MALTDTEMDGITVVELLSMPLIVRTRDGESQVGLTFRDHIRVRFSDGTDAFMTNPLKNLEFHDGNVNGIGHGPVVFKIVPSNFNQEDGNIVHEDLSNP